MPNYRSIYSKFLGELVAGEDAAVAAVSAVLGSSAQTFLVLFGDVIVGHNI